MLITTKKSAMPDHKNSLYNQHHQKLAKELDLSISAVTTLRGIYFEQGQDLKKTIEFIQNVYKKRPTRTHLKEALDFLTYAEEEHIKLALMPDLLSTPVDHLKVTPLLV